MFKLDTVNSNKSLVLFSQNRSSSNIHNISDGQDIRLLLKPFYVKLFRHISNELKTKQYASFVKLWHKICDSICDKVRNKLRTMVLNDYEDAASDIEAVVMKFRGNVGEIFAEAFFKSSLVDFIDGSSYLPVDPTNEWFIDADAKSSVDGLPMGIQVKNYSVELVKKETFDKAAAMDCYQLRINKIIKQDDIVEYLSSPRQIIFSFTDSTKLLISSHKDVVIFLGPQYIDNKCLHGDIAKGIPSRWQMFNSIADAIEKVK